MAVAEHEDLEGVMARAQRAMSLGQETLRDAPFAYAAHVQLLANAKTK
jgi:hypothetical protein